MPTKVTREDLQFYPSERLTDTPDGGGLMVGTPLTGAKNEVFSPVSTEDRVNGALSIKKLFAAVLRPDDEPVYGAHIILAKPPVTPNWSFLIFKSISEAEERQSAADRIASYGIKTIESRMTMMSTQAAGSRIVQAYQRVDEPLPKVGEVYCLDQDKTGYEKAEQYVRVQSVTDEVRTFTQNNTDFECRVVTIETDSPLDHSFVGVNYPSKQYAYPPCLIRETHVADSGKYYGVKQLKENANTGDLSVTASSLFEKITPTATAETPFINESAAGVAASLVDASKPGADGIVSYQAGGNFTPADSLILGMAITPGSLDMTQGSVLFTDSNGDLLADGVKVGKVLYARGELTTNSNSYNGTKNIKFRPAAAVTGSADSAIIQVTTSNQRRNYVISIKPKPARGSLTFSYRAQGVWYTLKDIGNGTLSGATEAYGAGAIDFVTDTVAVTLGYLPDVDTDIIISWSAKAHYENRTGITFEDPRTVLQTGQPMAPNTVGLTYDNNGSPVTINDDGDGNITDSNVTAKVNYPLGEVEIISSILPGADVFGLSYTTAERHNDDTVVTPSGSGFTLDFGKTDMAPKSLWMQVWLNNSDSDVDPTDNKRGIIISDNGTGNLVTQFGDVCGTINYSAGTGTMNAVSLDIEVGYIKTYTIPLPDGSQRTYTRRRYEPRVFTFTGSIAATSFAAGSATNTVTASQTVSSITVNLAPTINESIVPGSVFFEVGNKKYYDRDGNLYTEHNAATGEALPAGTINYQSKKANITEWAEGAQANPKLTALLTTNSEVFVTEIAFRIPAAPVAPQSLQILGTFIDAANFDVNANADGLITTAGVAGRITYETGVTTVKFGEYVTAAGNESQTWYDAAQVRPDGTIWKPKAVYASTLKYNAVSYSYIPLDNSIVGINTARLPSDGLVPIFRKGDMVVIAARWEQNLGSVFTADQEIQLNETDLTVMCFVDSEGKHVHADLYDVDLAQGKITMATPLDLSDYTLPLFARYAKDEENRVTEVDISGKLTLQFPIKRSYDKANSFVSSALIAGDLQVRATKPFTQQSWNGVWSDERETNEILAQLDTRNNPIELTDDGTMTERWLIKFKNATQFELYGETVGLVAISDTLQDLSPINPSTGKRYFTLKKEAFGDGVNFAWENGNCARFNTESTSEPFFITRAVQPSADPQISADGYDLIFRADTVEI
ncbi:MAG: hypothetical protein CR974_04110 [Gammaproteobacteria bacterium]|nr:MAG: hypothetical protein CR974_04110 [Gammaproteobacteria bacterium]